MNDRILATYWIETPHSVEHAAEVIAGEQSCGTFVRVPGETSELRARHRAQVERLEILGLRDAPSLPGSRGPTRSGPLEYKTAKVVISFPLENVGTNLPTVLSTVAGNLFELSEMSGLRLIDVEFPDAFRNRYPGPQFGFEGTRKLAGVWGRPLVGTIIKPSVGLAGISHLRRHCQLPIHGHRNRWGMLTRCPSLGMDFAAYQKFWRLAGVDHIHVNGLKNKFWEPDESVVQSIKACLKPLLGGYAIMPVISSGQWGGQAPETYQLTRTIDLLYLAGGGIMAHPGGPAAGLQAIHQAWEAALSGVPLETYASNHSELREAIAKFGRLSSPGAAPHSQPETSVP